MSDLTYLYAKTKVDRKPILQSPAVKIEQKDKTLLNPDFLIQNSISEKEYLSGLVSLANILENLVKRRKGYLETSELKYLEKINFNLKAAFFKKNLEKKVLSKCENRSQFFSNHVFFQAVSIIFDTLMQINFKNKFLKRTDYNNIVDLNREFKDKIKIFFWFKEFKKRKKDFNKKEDIVSVIKAYPRSEQIRSIFWHNFSRKYDSQGPTADIDTTFNEIYGDCGDFTQMNAFLLKELGFNPKIILVQIGPHEFNDTHSFVTVKENSKEYILDYYKMPIMDNNKSEFKNFEQHVNGAKIYKIMEVFYEPYIKFGKIGKKEIKKIIPLD